MAGCNSTKYALPCGSGALFPNHWFEFAVQSSISSHSCATVRLWNSCGTAVEQLKFQQRSPLLSALFQLVHLLIVRSDSSAPSSNSTSPWTKKAPITLPHKMVCLFPSSSFTVTPVHFHVVFCDIHANMRGEKG